MKKKMYLSTREERYNHSSLLDSCIFPMNKGKITQFVPSTLSGENIVQDALNITFHVTRSFPCHEIARYQQKGCLPQSTASHLSVCHPRCFDRLFYDTMESALHRHCAEVALCGKIGAMTLTA